MPQRFLRPGITNSTRWNSVSSMAGGLFIRLLTLVDDYGRTDGRASVIFGSCFSVWNECNPKNAVKLQQVADMLQQLAHNSLVRIYEIDGKRVLQIEQWQERIREGCKSKWPEFTEVAASCSELLPSPSSSPPTPVPTPLHPAFIVPEAASAAVRGAFEKWMTVRRAMGKKPNDWAMMFGEQFEWLSKFEESERLEIISQSIRNNWQGLFEVKGRGNAAHQGNSTKSNRTYGTANERRIGQYDNVGKV